MSADSTPLCRGVDDAATGCPKLERNLPDLPCVMANCGGTCMSAVLSASALLRTPRHASIDAGSEIRAADGIARIVAYETS